MSKIQKNVIPWLLLLLPFGIHANELIVSGRVFFGQEHEPIPNFPVSIQTIGSNMSEQTFTNGNGVYLFVLDIQPSDLPFSLIVETTDFCTGMQIQKQILIFSGFDIWGLDFYICEGIITPPEPTICSSFFYFALVEDSPLSVSFFDLSFSDGIINDWQWNFGDGIHSAETDPFHTYSMAGMYEVTLSITSEEDCSSTQKQVVFIDENELFEAPDCQAMFVFTQDSIAPNTFYFKDYSYGSTENWQWDFGDGNGSSEQNPVHSYALPGIYQAKLTKTSDQCTSQVSMLIQVAANVAYETACTALFIPIILDSLTVQFLNLSAAEASSFEWEFGDGSVSNEYIVAHQYADSSSYNCRLTIQTAEGCSNTFNVHLDLENRTFTGQPEYAVLNDAQDVEKNEEIPIRIYPNPAQQRANLLYESPENSDITIEIIHTNGQLIRVEKAAVHPGTNTLSLNLSDLSNGAYVVRLTQDGQSMLAKIIKHF